ncbi:hypothetical protein [Lactiplantibacillus garii]|uniref:hypothetical protein n=1 Tax=Lactiplantibacillus garii TaxID=2306423 RepID=UPI000F62B06A|nr:hypothetical protein [Lactiplantibacillus garii]
MKWNWVNGYLTAAYLLFYPLVIYFAPQLNRNPLKFVSLGTRALHQITAAHHNLGDIYRDGVGSHDRLAAYNEMNDNQMNMTLNFIIQGVLLPVALPVLLIILGRCWWEHQTESPNAHH